MQCSTLINCCLYKKCKQVVLCIKWASKPCPVPAEVKDHSSMVMSVLFYIHMLDLIVISQACNIKSWEPLFATYEWTLLFQKRKTCNGSMYLTNCDIYYRSFLVFTCFSSHLCIGSFRSCWQIWFGFGRLFIGALSVITTFHKSIEIWLTKVCTEYVYMLSV